MEVKNKLVLEVKVNERLYSLEVASDAPLGEAYDALQQLLSYVVSKINENQKASQPAEKEPEVPVEAPVVEAQPVEVVDGN